MEGGGLGSPSPPLVMENWPPPNQPAWPPPPYERWEASDLESFQMQLDQSGGTHRAPTAQERQTIFNPAACSEGHQVTGRIAVINGVTYYFAMCRGPERRFLFPWEPYEDGGR